ncbi:MAG: helicase-related protein, partial [Candidatus Saccharimonadales bacterium]
MNKREFGHKENNYTPIGGYNTAKHSPQGRGYNAYETPEQQSARWIRQERAAYDEAYPEEASFLRAQTVVKEREYVPSGSFDLPVWAKASEIAYAITHDPVTFVVGETGSGKSTQLPQIALNAGVKYVQQLQPLRLAARTIGERVGEEILSARPYESPEIVGIHTGEVNTSTARTKFLSATEGIVYAQDVHNRPMQEGELRIHDEIHKAGIIGDMAIAMSVDRMRKNPDMRIVLQSATFDVERWVNYFEKELGVTPTIIEVEGRTYPVEVIEKPEVESPEQAIECIKEHYAIHQQQKKMVADGYEGELTLTSGAVACPGLGEIKMWTEEIIKGLPAEMVNGIKFVPLHSRQTRKDQERALRTDYDELKVIMGTDAMRSSVTVEDLGWLVDCGYARHLELDKEGVESLVLYPTSHADRMQWMGRIGRMGPGKGYQTKMSVAGPYIPLDEAHRFDEPEIKRSNIEEFILGVKAVGINFEDLPLPARADVAVVERCRENLRKVGALDDAYELTAIGRRMVDCSTGYISARMLVEADKYSPDVRAYMAAIAASQEAGGLQSFRMNGSKRWKGEDGLTTENTSDLFAQLDLFIAAQHLPPYEWRQYDLDEKSIKQAREYYYKMIRKSKATFGKLEAPNAE